MAYYAAMERREVLALAVTRTDSENIILNEITQTQEDKYHVIPLTQSI